MFVYQCYTGLYALSADISVANLDKGDLSCLKDYHYVNGLLLEIYDHATVHKWSSDRLVASIVQLTPKSIRERITYEIIQDRLLNIVLQRRHHNFGTAEYMRFLNEFFYKADSRCDRIQPPPTSVVFCYSGIFTFSSELSKTSLNNQLLHRIIMENFTNGLILELVDYGKLCDWDINYIIAIVYAVVPEEIVDNLSDGNLRDRILMVVNARASMRMDSEEYVCFVKAPFDAGQSASYNSTKKDRHRALRGLKPRTLQF
ncbi:hypothetical protein Ahia01_000600900 [Argonauta hians]